MTKWQAEILKFIEEHQSEFFTDNIFVTYKKSAVITDITFLMHGQGLVIDILIDDETLIEDEINFFILLEWLFKNNFKFGE